MLLGRGVFRDWLKVSDSFQEHRRLGLVVTIVSWNHKGPTGLTPEA